MTIYAGGRHCMAADRPFTRQYDVFVGGLNGVPAALLPMSVMETNENYIVVPSFPFATLFSRGGVLDESFTGGEDREDADGGVSGAGEGVLAPGGNCRDQRAGQA